MQYIDWLKKSWKFVKPYGADTYAAQWFTEFDKSHKAALNQNSLEVKGYHGTANDKAVHAVPNVSQVGSWMEDESQVEHLKKSTMNYILFSSYYVA